MIGRFLESANPTIPIVVESDFNELESGTVYGVKNNVVGLYAKPINTIIDMNEDRIISDSMFFPTGPKGILHQDVEYLMETNSDRNIYINTDTVAGLYAKYNPITLHLDPEKFMEEISVFASGVHTDKYSPYMSKYMRTAANLESLVSLKPFHKVNQIPANVFSNLFPDRNTTEINITKIDKELVNALKNPERYIDFLKEKLTLDKKIGYYCYDKIPYICQHEFMLYDGKPFKDVVDICGDASYKCMYCGTQFPFKSDDDNLEFDKKQYKLVYSFIGILNMNNYESTIGKIVITAIYKSIEKLDISVTDADGRQKDGFTAAYLLKLVRTLQKEKFPFKNESPFLTFAESIFQKAGWDDKIVNQLLSNEERFITFSYVKNTILSLKRSEKELVDSSTDIRSMLIEGTPIKKLYDQDKSKLGIMFDKMMLENNNYTQLNVYDKFKDRTIAFDKITNEFHAQKSSNSIKSFYEIWWRELCPVNIEHSFDKSGTCKYCKINEKNVAQICEKYAKELDALLNIETKCNLKLNDEHRKLIISKINASKTNIPKTLDERVLTDNNLDKFRKCLEDLIGIGQISEIPVSKENCLKMINYLIDSDVPGSKIISEINASLIPQMENIGKLILILHSKT